MISKTEEEIMKNWKGQPDDPIVSIRCLAYNHEKYIEQTLDGFLIQETDFPFEIVIHDDASTDRTADIIREYEKKYPHIMRPIYDEENLYSKHDGSLNRRISPFIRGRYTALCEGDDYWTSPVKLQKQISYMLEHEDCSMTFHAVDYLENGKITKNDRITDIETDISAEQIIEGGGLFCATASLCYKTEYRNYNTKYIRMADVGDYPLQIHLSTVGTVHYFPEIMGVYRYGSEGSWTARTQSKEKIVRHLNIEINWLYEFNRYSEYKYSDSVLSKIINHRNFLFYLGEKQEASLAKKDLKKMSKNYKTEFRPMVRRMSREKNFPRLLKIYRAIKRRIRPKERQQQI